MCLPPLVAMRLLALSALVVALSACDTGGLDEPPEEPPDAACPEDPPVGADFFPAAVGAEWAFDAEFGQTSGPFSGPGYRYVGVTTWTFVASECDEGTHRFTVEELFAGRAYSPDEYGGPFLSRDSVRYERELRFTRSDSVTLGLETVPPRKTLGSVASVPSGRYSNGPIPASYPASAPDTASTRSECPPCDRTASAPRQTLVRGRGVVSLSGRFSLSAGGQADYYELVRED